MTAAASAIRLCCAWGPCVYVGSPARLSIRSPCSEERDLLQRRHRRNSSPPFVLFLTEPAIFCLPSPDRPWLAVEENAHEWIGRSE